MTLRRTIQPGNVWTVKRNLQIIAHGQSPTPRAAARESLAAMRQALKRRSDNQENDER